MVAERIDGKAVAAEVRGELRAKVAAFEARVGRPPGLDVVLVGDDPASHVYVTAKEKAAAEVGIRGRAHRLASNTSRSTLFDLIRGLNADVDVDGILVQLPVPRHLDATEIVDWLDPAKDIDGLHPLNAGLLAIGRKGLRPCTPLGCMRLLERIGYNLEGKRAIVVGRSNLVGKPIIQLLLEKHATVTVAHSRSQNLAGLVAEADVVIAAVGRPRLVRGEWLKPGAVVIDVGINRTDEGKLVGDVDYASASERAGFITPVPGGVGPMTIAMLLENTLAAAEARLLAK